MKCPVTPMKRSWPRLTCNLISNSGQFLSRILNPVLSSGASYETTKQWRAAIGRTSSSRLCNLKCVRTLSFVHFVCNMFVVSLLVYVNTCTCAMLLIVSGNIELNPTGPINKNCPQCEKKL